MYECSKLSGNTLVMTKIPVILDLIEFEIFTWRLLKIDFNIFWGSNLPQETPRGWRLWRSQYFPLLRNIRISTNTPSQTPATRLLTVNPKVCEVHSPERPGGLAYPYHLITHTMFYFCVRTLQSGFWCASISCCLKSKCSPAAVFNINAPPVRDSNIFSSGDIKIGPPIKPFKLLIAKRLPIWSLVKAWSYDRTPFRQASVLVVVVRKMTLHGVIRTRGSIDKWLTISLFKFLGLQRFGVLRAIPCYANKKKRIKFNGCY